MDTEKVIQLFETDIPPQLTEKKDSYNLSLLTANREDKFICMPECVRIEEDLFKQLSRIVGILSARKV